MSDMMLWREGPPPPARPPAPLFFAAAAADEERRGTCCSSDGRLCLFVLRRFFVSLPLLSARRF